MKWPLVDGSEGCERGGAVLSSGFGGAGSWH